MTTLRQVVNVVETLYPLRYAESWDAPGLIVGEPVPTSDWSHSPRTPPWR